MDLNTIAIQRTLVFVYRCNAILYKPLESSTFDSLYKFAMSLMRLVFSLSILEKNEIINAPSDSRPSYFSIG